MTAENLKNKIVYLCLKKIIKEAIRLEFMPEIREKILEFLSSFSFDELKITQEDPDFDENRKKYMWLMLN